MTNRTVISLSKLHSILKHLVIGCAFALVVPAYAGQDPVFDEQCLLEQLKSAPADMKAGDIRASCRKPEEKDATAVPVVDDGSLTEEDSSARQRLAMDRKSIVSPYSILAHKPNYFLFGAYNHKGWDSSLYRRASGIEDYRNQDLEGQFQISMKVPLALDLFAGFVDIYAAYTNRSFWQMYNRSYSEPFRETNHEPEMWLQLENDWTVFGFTNVVNTLGLVHQSNGRAGASSRSWNRVYANFIFEKDNVVVSFKPWVWITQDWSGSDNPDITDYLGHGEFRAAWHRNGHVVSVMLRNQLESRFDQGAIELGWSFPVFDYPYLKGYVQYFNGYGESLIDYNNKVNRIGIGLSLTDWLD